MHDFSIFSFLFTRFGGHQFTPDSSRSLNSLLFIPSLSLLLLLQWLTHGMTLHNRTMRTVTGIVTLMMLLVQLVVTSSGVCANTRSFWYSFYDCTLIDWRRKWIDGSFCCWVIALPYHWSMCVRKKGQKRMNTERYLFLNRSKCVRPEMKDWLNE